MPRFLLSPLELVLESALFRPALGILRSCFRIFETLFQIDSFLFPDMGLESEQDFDSVSKRARSLGLDISRSFNSEVYVVG